MLNHVKQDQNYFYKTGFQLTKIADQKEEPGQFQMNFNVLT